jgi:hypothetical protein
MYDALELREKREKPFASVVGKCSDIPVAAVQYSHYSTLQYSTIK